MSMIDALAIIREYLRQRPKTSALIGNRVWAGRTYPPSGYKPSLGPAICFQLRSGELTYENDHYWASVQFKLYGETEVDANDLFVALINDTLPSSSVSASIRHVELESGQMTMEEPDSEWIYALCYMRFMIRIPGGI